MPIFNFFGTKYFTNCQFQFKGNNYIFKNKCNCKDGMWKIACYLHSFLFFRYNFFSKLHYHIIKLYSRFADLKLLHGGFIVGFHAKTMKTTFFCKFKAVHAFTYFSNFQTTMVWKFKYLMWLWKIKTYFGLKRPLKGSLALSLALPLLLDFEDTFSRCLTVIFAYNPVLLYCCLQPPDRSIIKSYQSPSFAEKRQKIVFQNSNLPLLPLSSFFAYACFW